MSWSTLPTQVREIAERELTRKQLEALKLKLGGMSIRDIALALDVAPSTIQDRVTRAQQLIALALERQEAA